MSFTHIQTQIHKLLKDFNVKMHPLVFPKQICATATFFFSETIIHQIAQLCQKCAINYQNLTCVCNTHNVKLYTMSWNLHNFLHLPQFHNCVSYIIKHIHVLIFFIKNIYRDIYVCVCVLLCVCVCVYRYKIFFLQTALLYFLTNFP